MSDELPDLTAFVRPGDTVTWGQAQAEPRRFTAVELRYTVTGEIPPDQVQRAIDLSRDKYCSVWHSMRHDIPFDVTFQIEPGL